jgi:hypothetical protein
VTVPFRGRDDGAIEALVTDRYLESLLRDDPDASATRAIAGLDRDVLDAATRLATGLPRFHPSFRFEERLAVKLSDLAAGMRTSWRDGAAGSPDSPDGSLVPLDFDPLDASPLVDDRPGIVRPLLVGGAITSAALSIAAAAFVAWRRTRGRDTAMARAARAVARTRLA